MSDLMGISEKLLNKFVKLKPCKCCNRHSIRLYYNGNLFFNVSLQCMRCGYKTKNHINGIFAWIEWNMR